MRKVFHVDDDVDVREVVRYALTEQSYEVVSFGSPLEALEAMTVDSVEVPGIVLVDYTMPGLNGFNFIEKMRSLKAYQNVPTVLCSAQGEFLDGSIPEDIVLLPKPMDLDELLGLIRKHIPESSTLG